MKVHAVLFDAVGTLIHARPGVAEVYHQVGSRFGCRLTVEHIGERFREALRQERESAAGAGTATDERRERQRWRQIVEVVLGDGHCQVDLAFDGLWDHFARSQSWSLFDDVLSSLSELQRRGLTLGIASNFDARLVSVLRGLFHQVDGGDPFTLSPCHPVTLSPCHPLILETVFYSSKLGCSKPDLGFFREVERRLGMEGDSILLVGDDRRNDHLAAQAAGWRSLLLDRSGASVAGESRVITGLEEVVNYL